MKKNKFTISVVFFIVFSANAYAWNTPSHSSPSNGSGVWVGVTLDWNAVASSEKYHLQVDTTPLFNSPLLFQVEKNYINSSSGNSDTQHTMDNLFFGQTYYWRVRAWVTGDTSSWSTPWTINTRDYVSHSSPSSVSSTWTGVTIDWLAHTGVSFYDMQLDTSAAFNSPVVQTFSKAYINSASGNSDTEQYVSNLFFGQTYYWRVRARNAVDSCTWSTPWTFNTRDYVTHSSPSSGSSTWTGLTLDWDPHTGVSFYDLEVDTTDLFNSPIKIFQTNAYINSSNGNADTRHYAQDLLFGQTYYWRVRARNAVDSCIWSTPWTFNTRDYVTLVSPNDGQLNVAVAGVGLDWSAHVGISYYQLEIDTINLFNSISLTQLDKPYINSSSGNNDTYQHTGPLLANQIYFWRVRAVNAVDTSAWTVRSFSTGNNPVLIPSVPVLISPFNGASGILSSTTFEWQISSNATSYEFVYDTLSNFATAIIGNTINTSEIITGLNNNHKTYYWKVRALNGPSIYSDWSVIWTFETGTTVGTEILFSSFKVYPNPFIDFICVEKTTQESIEMYIYDIAGQLIYGEAIEEMSNQIDLTRLPSGLYHIAFVSKHGTSFVKIVKP